MSDGQPFGISEELNNHTALLTVYHFIQSASTSAWAEFHDKTMARAKWELIPITEAALKGLHTKHAAYIDATFKEALE